MAKRFLAFVFANILSMALASDEFGPIRFATLDHFKPYSWLEDGEIRGVDYDITMQMCQRVGVTCLVDVYPWSEVLARVERGDSAFAFAALKSVERERYSQYLNYPLHFTTYNVFVRKDSGFRIHNLNDLTGLRVGLTENFFVSEEFSAAVEQGKFQLVTAVQPEENLNRLVAGEADAVVGNLYETLYMLKELGLDEVITTFDYSLTESKPSYIIVSKAADIPAKSSLSQLMNSALREMYRDGSIQEIYEAYFGSGFFVSEQ